MSGDLVGEIERRVNEEIAADREIRVATLPREEAFSIPDLIRTKINLLPEGITEVRTIEIVASTCRPMAAPTWRTPSEIGRVTVTGYESKGRINKRIRIEVGDADASPPELVAIASPALDTLVARVERARRLAPGGRRDLRRLPPQLDRHEPRCPARRNHFPRDRRHSRHVAARLGGAGAPVRPVGGRGRDDPRAAPGPHPPHGMYVNSTRTRMLQRGGRRERAPVRPDRDDAVDLGAQVGARLALLPGRAPRVTGGTRRETHRFFDEDVHRMLTGGKRGEQHHATRSRIGGPRCVERQPVADGDGAPVETRAWCGSASAER